VRRCTSCSRCSILTLPPPYKRKVTPTSLFCSSSACTCKAVGHARSLPFFPLHRV
jgi:hypothetical protein